MAEEMIKVTLRLPKNLVKQAKHYAVDQEIDLQDVVAKALQLLLAKKRGA